MKGKSWGSLTAPVSGEFRTNTTRSASGKPSGKYVAVGRSKEYATNVVGSHGGKPSGKFLGQTGHKGRHGEKLTPKRS